MFKHVSLTTFAVLAISLASIRAEDNPAATGATPASATLGQPDANGFISLFNGKDLTGWEGLEGYWSVKNGVIDGSETKDHSVQTDLILSASKEHPEKFVNFELHIKWMLVSLDGNSGVQFRSAINNAKTLHAGGYQADIDPSSSSTRSRDWKRHSDQPVGHCDQPDPGARDERQNTPVANVSHRALTFTVGRSPGK